jgi:hypothetical protein
MKSMKREMIRRRRVGVVALVLITFHVSRFTSAAWAKPTQAEVFRSIQQNVGQRSDDSGKGLAIVLGGVAALIMVLLVGSRVRRMQSVPKVVDRPKRLLREVMKSVPLKPKELKQLKLLADEGGEPVQSPLTLILCPSVLARTLKNRPLKVDRAVIAQVVRKMGVAAESKSQK